MSDKKGISLSRYFKLPKWEVELKKQNPLAGDSVMDDRLLDELKSNRLPKQLHDAFLDEMWTGRERVARSQAEKAAQPRRDELLTSITEDLAQRGGSAKELWPALFSMLEEAGAGPEETCDTENSNSPWSISYLSAKGDARRVSYKTFQNLLSAERKKKIS